MCGFVGYKFNHSDVTLPKDLMLEAIETIHHRGPDHTGFWEDQSHATALAHKRLSIPRDIRYLISCGIALEHLSRHLQNGFLLAYLSN